MVEIHSGYWLGKAMKRAGVTAQAIADELDVSVQAVYKWVNTGNIARARLADLARLAKTTPTYLLTGVEEQKPLTPGNLSDDQVLNLARMLNLDDGDLTATDARTLLENRYGGVGFGPDTPGIAASGDGPAMIPFKAVPVVGIAQLGPEGFWYEPEHAIGHGDGYIDTPTRDPNAYALEVRGDSMAPAIRNGWFVVCEPNSPVHPGEYVMIQTKDGRSMVKELLYRRNGMVALDSVNQEFGRMQLRMDEIEKMHYVAFVVPPSKRRL